VETSYTLPLLIFLPLMFAAVIVASPAAKAKKIALAGAMFPFAALLPALWSFAWADGSADQLGLAVDWMPEIGLAFRLGVDSISLLLIVLTVLLGPICVLASYTAITTRVKTYYAWLLVLQAAMTGVFASQDIILFYICFEFTLVPMWILIHLYGSTNRAKAATKFFLYTFTGSMIALAGLVYVVWHCWLATGAWTFEIAQLSLFARTMTPSQQGWVLLALMAGFAVKVPLFPVHTWLPLAHTEAPTAGSVILAGVLLKLGTYGIFRFALGFAPVAVYRYQELIAVLAIVGIVYAGLVCWVQTDVKKLVAYSSVAHLGFCILGLVALNATGITGSVMYMINHGLSTGALFLLIGMVYERYHTRSMKELGGLAAVMPVWSTFMIFFIMASVGLPGLNGFVSEFLCLMGTFQASSEWWAQPGGAPGASYGKLGFWYALVAGTGMIIAAMYLLYMAGRIVWGPLVLPPGHDHGGHEAHGGQGDSMESHASPLPRDLSRREIGILLPLAAACLSLGVYPKPVLDVLQPPIDSVVKTVRHDVTAAFPSMSPQPRRLPVSVEGDEHDHDHDQDHDHDHDHDQGGEGH
jgi:NADH-quinone oxidoreductase subunit M